MKRKFLSQINENRPSSRQISQLYRSNNINRLFENSQHERNSALKSSHSQTSSLSKLKSPKKNNTNTCFSNRLFSKAHKVNKQCKETYLPSNGKIPPTNQTKIKELYQIYQKTNGDKGHQRNKGKRLSLQLSQPPIPQDSEQKNMNPFISSLTNIILNHCQIENNQTTRCIDIDCSEWINILCEIELSSATSQKKTQKEHPESPSDNPYGLLPQKSKRLNKENKNLNPSQIKQND